MIDSFRSPCHPEVRSDANYATQKASLDMHNQNNENNALLLDPDVFNDVSSTTQVL